MPTAEASEALVAEVSSAEEVEFVAIAVKHAAVGSAVVVGDGKQYFVEIDCTALRHCYSKQVPQ